MGRHRRSAAGPVAADHADVPAGRHQGSARRRKKRAAPVRTGLLGVSAAVALGAVAVTSGLLPGGENFSISGGSGDRVSAEGTAGLETQGGSSAQPTDRATTPAAEDTGPAHAPSKSPSRTPSQPSKSAQKPSAKPSAKPSERRTAEDRRTEKPAAPPKTAKPERVVPVPSVKVPETGGGDAGGSGTETAAEAAVLTLVNKERVAAGCSPVRADRPLGELAQDFSEDMAARGFFDHTDPDGATPWDRAEKAGIDGLGGENIARGQADAEAVMDAWMNSEGHRANILNCEFKTLGVGVHMAPGGPWWTQNFGF